MLNQGLYSLKGSRKVHDASLHGGGTKAEYTGGQKQLLNNDKLVR
jgi:hypothetical protein